MNWQKANVLWGNFSILAIIIIVIAQILFMSCDKNDTAKIFFFFFFFWSVFSRAAPRAYGGSQAREPIRAVATGLRQSHSSAGS